MQRTKPGSNGASPLILVFDAPESMRGKWLVTVLGLAVAVGCDSREGEGKQATHAMRQDIHPGMTLAEVFQAVEPHVQEGRSIVVGRNCGGDAEVVALSGGPSVYSLERYARGVEARTTPMPRGEVQKALAAIATCPVVKVGHGVFEVHLSLDGTRRVREISPVLLLGNPEAPAQ